MCYFNRDVRILPVIFQNTRLLAFKFNAQLLHTHCGSRQLFLATISGSTTKLRTTDRGRSTVTLVCREGEMLRLVRQTHKETICKNLRGSPRISLAGKNIRTTTNVDRATNKVKVNLFWWYVQLEKIIHFRVNLLIMSCKETFWRD